MGKPPGCCSGRALVALIDCHMGNLHSLKTALQRAGAEVRIITGPEGITGADGLLLPGVGAFGTAMQNLESQKLTKAVLDWLASDKPLMAVCVGMQILFEESEELGLHKGLGVVKGAVRRLPSGMKVPEMGWNTISLRPAASDSPYGPALVDGGWYYFAHSYCAEAGNDPAVLAVTSYGVEYASVVGRGRMIGTQFHPEKSAEAGLRLLERFVAIVRGEA